MMNITLKQVDAFLAVAQTLNFSRAAKLVHLSQPALSANIRRLEEAVGARLFDRDTRTVALSPVGAEFLNIASGLLESVDNGLSRIRGFVSGKRGLIALAVAPSLAASFLPDIIVRFSATYPGIELKLYDVLSDPCIEMVRSGAVDLALTPKVESVHDLLQREVFIDDLVVLCAKGHPITRQKSVDWADIQSNKHIAKKGESSVRQFIDQEYLRQGQVFRPAFEVDNAGTMFGLILAGLGIGIFPKSILGSFNMKGLAYRPFHPSARAHRTICAITSRTRSQGPTLECFVQFCREKAMSQRDS
jgi:LysR family carnitine catabolism transcriptional activator